MRFLILNADYPGFLRWLYSEHLGLEKQPYEEQLRVRNESLFGVADFYSSNLRKLGHEAWDIHTNNEYMQKAWAEEKGMQVKEPMPLQGWRKVLQRARKLTAQTPVRWLRPLYKPLLHTLDRSQLWLYDILEAQIKHYKPDILLNQAMNSISSHFLRRMKVHTQLLVGQIASPLPQREDFGCYDLIISSLPNLVNHFRKLGVLSELHGFAFEPRVLERIERNNKAKIPVSFVGSLSTAHKARIRLLEYMCQRLLVEVWGRGNLAEDSPIYQRCRGEAWGIKMYQILYDSKITLNIHVDLAGQYANNMRLFEATGVGALLVTDMKRNLHEMFEVGKEVVAFRTPEECAELIQYYLEHEDERMAIARAGQERTLRDHTYYNRMLEFVDIVERCLDTPESLKVNPLD